MSSVLDRIVADTWTEVARLRASRPQGTSRGYVPAGLAKLLRRAPGAPLALIAEIKRRSPSAGALSVALSVADRARVYEAAGASVISVLVDRAHFDGDYHHIMEAREATSLPILCKGFVVDEVQIQVARAMGADAVLLIARILDGESLPRLTDASIAAGLAPVVEVVDEDELRRALATSAEIIGVNSRDLSSLKIDTERAHRLAERVPSDRVALIFSGIRSPTAVEDVAMLNPEGGGRPIDGVLVGEALMRCDDPTALLREMTAAASAGAARSG